MTETGSRTHPGERDSEAGAAGLSFRVPTVTIYQDPSHVEDILQQADRGLITAASDASDLRNTQTSSGDVTGKGELGAEIKLPGVGGVHASAHLSGSDGSTFEGAAGQQITRNYKYTSAYYLYRVREDLRAAGLLKSIALPEHLDSLSIGDFVEFQAKFSPDELISLMDVFNPEMVAGLVRWFRRSQAIPRIVGAATEEERQAAFAEYQTRSETDAEFAKAIVEAVRVDFRSAATREYYGSIGSNQGITAVVVCDTRSFLVEDADRILDGHFTVLGKVSTPPTADVPVLARNKILDRIQPEAVDWMAESLRSLAQQQIEQQQPDGSTFPIEQQTLEQYLDLKFPSRIDGISFKVIPIAIYIWTNTTWVLKGGGSNVCPTVRKGRHSQPSGMAAPVSPSGG